MDNIIVYGLFVIGFVLLIKGADWLVTGSSSIAKKANISDFVVGLTIVSMGTSMPELIVNIIASLNGNADIALGNIIGSNISNIYLILGVSAIIYPLTIHRNVVKMEIPYSILGAILLGFLANASFFSSTTQHQITRFDAFMLLVFFAMFLIYVIRSSKEGNNDLLETPDTSGIQIPKAITLVILGCVALFLGGKWVVEGAENIALQMGMSQTLVGLTVVAIGTSLPELVTSAVAAYKKNTDIAVANVLGSNIFNLLWVLGISAAIRPLPFDEILNTDLLILVLGSILLMLSVVTGKKSAMGKKEGIVFLFGYIAYLAYLINRG